LGRYVRFDSGVLLQLGFVFGELGELPKCRPSFGIALLLEGEHVFDA
jgi:hypothetical protein